MQPETAAPALVSAGPSSLSNDASARSSKPACDLHPDTSKILTEISRLRQAVVKGKRRKNKKKPTKKRPALEPLMNGPSNEPGRSAKRVKLEEQEEPETMDLKRAPSPHMVQWD